MVLKSDILFIVEFDNYEYDCNNFKVLDEVHVINVLQKMKITQAKFFITRQISFYNK